MRQQDDIAPNNARAARLFSVLAFVGIAFAFTYGPDALRLKMEPPTAPRASDSIGENLSFAMVSDFIYTTVPEKVFETRVRPVVVCTISTVKNILDPTGATPYTAT